MKHFVLLVISFMFLTLGNAFAEDGDLNRPQVGGGIDFTYTGPEMFFPEPGVLKLSVIWEILNCFEWHHGRPVNQCRNLEFYVVSPITGGDAVFTSVLEGTECLTDGCEAIVRLPLVALLTPVEYERYKLGLVVVKDIQLYLAFGGEEDEFGRIVGRHLAGAHYDLRFVLNGTGFGTVAIISLERSEPFLLQ